MPHYAEISEAYTPEVASVISGGNIPSYNVFPFSGSYRDLSSLLSDPRSNLANNVQSAVNGMMPGIVHNGSPQSVASDVLFYGRQAEIARAMAQQEKMDEARQHQSEHTRHEEAVHTREETKAAAAEPAPEHAKAADVKTETPSAPSPFALSQEASHSVSAIGKALSHIVETEFVIHVPAISLSSLTPAALPSAVDVAQKAAVAAFSLHF